MENWEPGKKHPDTPQVVFDNVTQYDRVRRILIARCRICRATVSRDEMKVRELLFECDEISCKCHKRMESKAHQVCDLCYNMHHALYTNYGMQNMNYFKEMDDRERRDWEDPNRRDRLGL